ncbi:metacaspase-9 [Dioscorea cayenensis subsp. rotundata]|uniref:Metacaspase-9 n=1 Tax=Dioscorea cayennensis subsp. rotundata TaxID=55577 RepID=A0AB40AGG1_DIOCR|nr:metacaspase-9 [Dioscorea cayenensis subsp. rotundata]
MEEGKKRVATLVGCNYANTKNELHGCINDVMTMRDLLVSRFGFKQEDIEVLTDAPDSPILPTGANIRRSLGRMVANAKPGDVLFFHYSGHGTLIPSAWPFHHGFKADEAIVPCDFNLITDLDFRQLVDQLAWGVSFTIISDSCHSGGLIDKEKEQIGPSSSTIISELASDPVRDQNHKPKLIPFDSVLQHLSSLSGIVSSHIGDHLWHLFGPEMSASLINRKLPVKPSSSSSSLKRPADKDDGILLSGCQANETSADMSPEGNNETRKAYGAFSNSIQMVLREHDGVLSNRELVIRARRLLLEQGFAQQHPCLYCSDDNAEAPFLWQTGNVKINSTL